MASFFFLLIPINFSRQRPESSQQYRRSLALFDNPACYIQFLLYDLAWLSLLTHGCVNLITAAIFCCKIYGDTAVMHHLHVQYKYPIPGGGGGGNNNIIMYSQVTFFILQIKLPFAVLRTDLQYLILHNLYLQCLLRINYFCHQILHQILCEEISPVLISHG